MHWRWCSTSSLNTPAWNPDVIFALDIFPNVDIGSVESDISWRENINGRDLGIEIQAWPANTSISSISLGSMGQLLGVYATVTCSVWTALDGKQTRRAACVLMDFSTEI